MTGSATFPLSSAPRRTSQVVVTEESRLRLLRMAVYAYFGFWLFEGALRKWVVPGLSAPLLIVRDPILIFIYFEALRQKRFKANGFTTFIVITAVLAAIVSLGLLSPPPLKVVLFGIHANFMHLPLIFLLPEIIDYRHVRKMGSFVLWLAPVMAALVALQFLSGSSSRWNAAAGGEGRMIETALNRIRPSGTFSFTTGLAEYTTFLAGFLLHQLLERKVFSKIAFLLAVPSLLVLVVMSGSRTTFALVGLQLLALVVIWTIKPRYLQSSVKLLAIGFLVVTIIGSIGALRLGVDVLASRFGDKDNVKTEFFARFFEQFMKPFTAAERAEPGGVGIGMGTNAASSMIYKTLRFNLGESELDRIIMEMGPYLGFPYLLWRISAVFYIVGVALFYLKRDANTLPLLLITASANDLILGQFGQSTVIGFAAMVSGLALAATKKIPDEGEDAPAAATALPGQTSNFGKAAPYAARLRNETQTPQVQEFPPEPVIDIESEITLLSPPPESASTEPIESVSPPPKKPRAPRKRKKKTE